MNPVPTSVSLLDRLKLARPDASDWGRLQGIYLPLIRRWLARVPGLGDEADDLAQDVFLVVVRELPRFERRREGSFRAWLRKVTVNKARSHWRRRRRRPAAGSAGCGSTGRARTRRGSGTSWRSACCGARPRPWSSTIPRSSSTRSHGEPSVPGDAYRRWMERGVSSRSPPQGSMAEVHLE
jgi:DNA-directed RNA polymerase specialized sigma24 family protein